MWCYMPFAYQYAYLFVFVSVGLSIKFAMSWYLLSLIAVETFHFCNHFWQRKKVKLRLGVNRSKRHNFLYAIYYIFFWFFFFWSNIWTFLDSLLLKSSLKSLLPMLFKLCFIVSLQKIYSDVYHLLSPSLKQNTDMILVHFTHPP